MILNYTYRIKPDQQQTQLLDEWLETLFLGTEGMVSLASRKSDK
ncbi:MAG: helix-turn-helix domain-containing protein [Coleofasciculus sp. G3-WIS-01]